MEFDIEQRNIHVAKVEDTSKITQLLMKYFGAVIKSEKQAELFLLAFCVVGIGCIVYLLSTTVFPSQSVEMPPIYQEDLTPEFRSTLSPEVIQSIPYKYEN